MRSVFPTGHLFLGPDPVQYFSHPLCLVLAPNGRCRLLSDPAAPAHVSSPSVLHRSQADVPNPKESLLCSELCKGSRHSSRRSQTPDRWAHSDPALPASPPTSPAPQQAYHSPDSLNSFFRPSTLLPQDHSRCLEHSSPGTHLTSSLTPFKSPQMPCPGGSPP